MATIFQTACKTGILALLASTVSIQATQAMPAMCGDRTKLVTILKDKYKEQPAAIGISQASTEAYEFFTSDTGTWTVIMTTSKGKTCIMATGHSWKEVAKKSLDPQT